MRELLELDPIDNLLIEQLQPVDSDLIRWNPDLVSVCLERYTQLTETIEKLPQVVRGLRRAAFRKEELLHCASRAPMSPTRR